MKAECEHGLDTRLPCGDCQKAYEEENAPSSVQSTSLLGFPGQDGKENMKDSCKKKDCAYWRDTPLGDSHHKCVTCCHSAWLPKSDKDNYKPNHSSEARPSKGENDE